MEEWAVATHSLSILLTESRLVVFLFNLVSLTLTLLILMGIELFTDCHVAVLCRVDLHTDLVHRQTPDLEGRRLPRCVSMSMWTLPCEICLLLLQECGRLLSVEASAAALSEDP